jgi:DNA-binding transcriptional MocR family regulator
MSVPIAPDRLAALLGRWAQGRGSLYLLLATRLRALIDEDTLPPDTRLPPERRLAQALSVGRGTVVAAYEQLRAEGRVLRRQGSSTRIAPRSLPSAAARGRSPHSTHFLSMFEPVPDGDDSITFTCAAPDTPPPELGVAYRAAVQDLERVRDDIGYNPAGLPVLRAVLAERFTRRGLPTEPAQVLVTSGAHQAIDLVLRGYASPGDTVLTECPTYPGALALFGASGVALRTVSVGAHGLDVAELLEALPLLRPALTYLVPSFQNPTGSCVPALQRRRITAAAAEHRLLVMDDETLADLGFDGEGPPPLASYPGGEHVVTVGSLSKVAWGGLRLGWVRAERGMIARLSRLKALSDLGNDQVSQMAAARLLREPGGLVQRRREELARRHEYLSKELAEVLPEWEWEPAAGGQTLWVRLPRGNAASFAQRALRHGVALLPGDALSPVGGASQHLRIPFLPEEQTITEAVRRMREAWEGYTGTDQLDPTALGQMVV